MYRRLAQAMVGAGLPVLRFDPTGTGDSQGSLDSTSLTDWVDDTVAAVEYMLRSTGCRVWGMFGVRLGATVALRSAQRLGGDGKLALWEPVLDGQVYLEELSSQHFRANRESHILTQEAQVGEFVGYRLGRELLEEIGAIAAGSHAMPGQIETLLMENETDRYRDFAEMLGHCGSAVTREVSPEALDLSWREDIGLAPLPHQSLRRVAEWMARS